MKAFIRELRGLAMRRNCAVLLLAHPSAEGLRSGSGMSGSTHWSNAVRSRLYLETPRGDGGAEIDPDLRELILKKSNRWRRGERITLRWREGMFVPEDAGAASDVLTKAHARTVFLDLLANFNAVGRRVSANPSRNFAPTEFEKEDGAKGIKNRAFRQAMSDLLSEGKIRIEVGGPPSKPREYLVVVGGPADTA